MRIAGQLVMTARDSQSASAQTVRIFTRAGTLVSVINLSAYIEVDDNGDNVSSTPQRTLRWSSSSLLARLTTSPTGLQMRSIKINSAGNIYCADEINSRIVQLFANNTLTYIYTLGSQYNRKQEI